MSRIVHPGPSRAILLLLLVAAGVGLLGRFDVIPRVWAGYCMLIGLVLLGVTDLVNRFRHRDDPPRPPSAV